MLCALGPEKRKLLFTRTLLCASNRVGYFMFIISFKFLVFLQLYGVDVTTLVTHRGSKNSSPSYTGNKWQNTDSNPDLLILNSELVALFHVALNLLCWISKYYRLQLSPPCSAEFWPAYWQSSHLWGWDRAVTHCHCSCFLLANMSHHSFALSSVLPLTPHVSGCLLFIFSFLKR